MLLVKQNKNADVFDDVGMFNVSEGKVPNTDTAEILSAKDVMKPWNLYSEACKLEALCEDYTIRNVTLDNLMFKDNGKFDLKPESFDGYISNVSISDYALGQLCAKLGVPKKYIDRCLKEYPTLATENINSWLEVYGKDLLIRCYDNKIRGVLSSKFSRFDIPEMLMTLFNAYDFSEYNVKGYYLSPERFHARLALPRNLDIPMEDDLLPGIQIDSSDVGRSVLTVQFLIFKQVCTNGLVLPRAQGVLFTQKHIGITVSEFSNELVQSVKKLPELIEHTSEIVTAAINKDVDISTCDKMLEYVEMLKHNSIPEDGAKRIINTVKMREYGRASQWSLINAITQEAQNYTLEKRLSMEKFASSLLSVA